MEDQRGQVLPIELQIFHAWQPRCHQLHVPEPRREIFLELGRKNADAYRAANSFLELLLSPSHHTPGKFWFSAWLCVHSAASNEKSALANPFTFLRPILLQFGIDKEWFLSTQEQGNTCAGRGIRGSSCCMMDILIQ